MNKLDLVEECLPCTQEGSNSKKTIIQVNDTFNERLKPLIKGDNVDMRPLDIGCPTDVLLSTGLPNAPIEISIRTLHAKQTQHNFKLLDVVHLPDSLSSPIAVFRSATTTDDRKVVLTELECSGCNMVVIIAPNHGPRSINSIRSIYSKEDIKDILLWIVEDNLLEYVDKEKILNWMGKHQSHSDEVTRLIKDATKIIQDF